MLYLLLCLFSHTVSTGRRCQYIYDWNSVQKLFKSIKIWKIIKINGQVSVMDHNVVTASNYKHSNIVCNAFMSFWKLPFTKNITLQLCTECHTMTDKVTVIQTQSVSHQCSHTALISHFCDISTMYTLHKTQQTMNNITSNNQQCQKVAKSTLRNEIDRCHSGTSY